MTTDEWAIVKAITARALAQPEGERDRVIAAECGGDERLRREVASLVASTARATDLYETPAFAPAEALARYVDDSGPVAVGGRIGAYRVLSELGRGGMGAAYLAVRADQAYEKRVALKLIKRGMDTDAILRRFRHERQILANLEHPNIVMLLDGGTTGDGLPYFVMEYVDGLPIDRYCDTHALPIVERLKLVQAVCGAVHHAHQQRVIHRDLKPSNILVTAAGVPKLLDFGIAKLLDAGPDPGTIEPTVLARAMTPQYASPEQARGETLTTASDIYSLGAMMYLLLTGRQASRFDADNPREAERVICEETPADPSTAVDADAARSRGERPEALRRQLAGNLDVITMTALRKEPGRRYATASAMADDIQRHVDGLPIQARRGRPELSGTRRIAAAIAASLAAAALVAATVMVARQPSSAAPLPAARSIAILPFANDAGDPDLDYLAEGITEDVINRLSLAPQLKVIARDSAFSYKGKAIDPAQVRRELGVDAILTGRVVQRSGRLSVSATLVDARDPRRLWSEQYDRRPGDVQSVQRELAQQIATSLRLQFTGDERGRLSRSHTHDADAYQLYLKGRYFWNKRTEDGLHTSVSYLNQAIARDPRFALAYAGLADSYGLLTEYHALPATETYARARDAIAQALAVDPLLAEAHTSLAYLRHFYEWDWRGAAEAYTRALALNPNYATGYQWYAEYLAQMGRSQEALVEIRKARAIDPLSLIINTVESNILYMAGQYDQAIDQAQQVIALDPNFPEIYESLKRAYDQKGWYKEAIAARQTRRRLLGRTIADTSALLTAAAATDARVYWRSRLAQEIAESRDEGVQPFEFAEILAQAGETRRALDWLERACAEHDFMMAAIRVAPNLAPLRAQPRYQALLRRGCRV